MKPLAQSHWHTGETIPCRKCNFQGKLMVITNGHNSWARCDGCGKTWDVTEKQQNKKRNAK